MSIQDFIKHLANINDTNIKQMGVKIGRGNNISFWRTVDTGTIKTKDLKKVIESTGEDFVILYKGQKYTIK